MVVAAAKGNSGGRSSAAVRRPRAAGPGGDAVSGSAAARGRARAARRPATTRRLPPSARPGHDDSGHAGARRHPHGRGARVVTRAAPGEAGREADRPSTKPKPCGEARPAHASSRSRPRSPAYRTTARRVPLVAFVPAVDELDRGLLAVAGIALLLVALGGAVVLGVARRQLGLAWRRSGCSPLLRSPAAGAAPIPGQLHARRNRRRERLVHQQRHDPLDVDRRPE